MDFKSLLELEMKMSPEEFASEFNLPDDFVWGLLQSNELSLDLIKKISKYTGLSVKDVIAYDAPGFEIKENKTLDVDIPSFEFISNENVLVYVDNWMKELRKHLVMSNETFNWLSFNVTKCFLGWDLDTDMTNTSYMKSKTIDQLNNLLEFSEQEIHMLQRIMDDSDLYKQMIKVAVKSEPGRLIEENKLIDEYKKELIAMKKRKRTVMHVYVMRLFSLESLNDLVNKSKRNNIDVNEELNNELSRIAVDTKCECISFCNDLITQFEEYYLSEEKRLFKDCISFFCSSVADTIKNSIVFEPSSSDLFSVVSEEEMQDRKKKYNKKSFLLSMKDAALRTLFFPVPVINLIPLNGHSTAQGIRECLLQMRVEDDFLDKQSSDISLICDAYLSAFFVVRREWKQRLFDIERIVELNESDITCLIDEEYKKKAVIASIIGSVKGWC